MEKNEIYDSFIQPRGLAYREENLLKRTHYKDPIDTSLERPAGNSHIWGDASPEVQSRAIDAVIEASQRAGLNTHQTAHVLATRGWSQVLIPMQRQTRLLTAWDSLLMRRGKT
jgi:hypothetical protein